MPYSIDDLSIILESQKKRIILEPPDRPYIDFTESDKNMCVIDNLVEQEPILIF